MGVMTGKIVEVNGKEVQLVLQGLDEEDLIKQVDAINEMEHKAKAFDELVELYPQKDEIPSDEFFMLMGYIIRRKTNGIFYR